MQNYGALNPTQSKPTLASHKGRFSITNLDLAKIKNDPATPIGYENPAFVTDGPVPPSPSPSNLSSNNPVLPPKNRKPSIIFPSYLRRNSNLDCDSLTLPALQTESATNLQVYTTINHESIPRLENYSRDINSPGNRPTIDELHEPSKYESTIQNTIRSDDTAHWKSLESKPELGLSGVKFGWFEGVFVRTCVNLLGVMLFLRMGWMTGRAGIVVALLQIAISTLITCLTTLSMNALCTNGDIGAGGIYSMISRSLGPEAGAMIGVIFALTNAGFVGLNLIGAAEAVVQILNHFGISVINPTQDLRIIGIMFLVLIAIIPMISLEFEAKTQTFFLFLLVICIADYFVGCVIPPTESQKLKGFVGWNNSVAMSNLWPKFSNEEGFFTVFGVFFPSVTPIFTGACMSGDLRDPASAIPKGTFLSIFATSLTYAVFILILGWTVTSYATGTTTQFPFTQIQSCNSTECPYGLINDYNTVALSSGLSHIGWEIEPFIYVGILAASLSSALGCYMAAPRIFQSFAEDGLIPGISWFAKGYGPSNDPRRGYMLTFLVAGLFTAIGNLNLIAPYISNFYLVSFFLVNITCWHADWVKTPSFRPSFKYFNKWISFISAIACFVLMFLLDWVSGLVALVLMMGIWLYISRQETTVNWGTTSEAQLFNLAHSSALKMYWAEEHVKNYRPMILVLSGNPSARPALIDMGYNLTRDYGMLFLGHIRQGEIDYESRKNAIAAQKVWLKMRKVKGFYILVEGENLIDGCKRIIPTVGLGQLRPNILMLGYKNNWHEMSKDPQDLQDYFDVIHFALDHHLSLIICRVQEGFDFSQFFSSVSLNGNQKENNEEPLNTEDYRFDYKFVQKIKRTGARARRESYIPPEVFTSVNQFQKTQKKGTIDIWWLYDTGGITLLLAWILRNQKNSLWYGCKLRVFSVCRTDIETAKSNLTVLLHKFRIPISDVTVLSDVDTPPSKESMMQFRNLIEDWMEVETEESMQAKPGTRITKKELNLLKDLTNRHIRLRELLLEHSQDATMIAMTLPMPRRDILSAPLYMAWLEMLTQNMPPFLLVRGTQLNVLTFYC
ncbi:solute carrier family 12 member 2-like [Brevipalpus obovatus]|uniref:solute carrier family 12 member 2-like n=1 Tax=Brevipalpus obovatus TaxID=246614 RepID=UPI003D9E3F21